MSPFNEQQVESEYHISWYIIGYKFLFGLIEAIIGIGILFYGHAALIWYRHYAARELLEDPHDHLVKILESIVPNLLTHNVFLAVYLVLLGGAKVAGSIGLMYKQNWGVDLLVGLTVIMFPFQLVKIIQSPSLTEAVYMVVGILIALYLINFKPHEWAKRMTEKVKVQ